MLKVRPTSSQQPTNQIQPNLVHVVRADIHPQYATQTAGVTDAAEHDRIKTDANRVTGHVSHWRKETRLSRKQW
jgi:hypothetical protein